MPTRSFKLFRERFLTELASPVFGDRRKAQTKPGLKNPVAKKLDRPGLRRLLESRRFLREIHKVLREYDRLVAEQKRIKRLLPSRYRPEIKRSRNIRHTLRTLAHRVRAIEKRIQTRVDGRIRDGLPKAAEALLDAEWALKKREENLVSRLHPITRTAKEEASPWEHLILDYDYELESLKLKAPDQYPWSAIDRRLKGMWAGANKKMSQMTRCTVTSVLCEAAGHGSFEPTTIKESLRRKAR